jgi:metal-responsive CopG/Arc/MetJ family transcriptional regulator
MKSIHISIDETLLAELDRIAGELGLSRSAYVRQALAAALSRQAIARLDVHYATSYTDVPASSPARDEWAALRDWGAP